MSSLPLVLGTAQLGMPYGVANQKGMMSEIECQEFLRTAWDLGYRVLDTAQAYGESEARIGRFIKAHPQYPFTVITKIPANLDTRSAQAVTDCIQLSVERLGAPLDGVLLHNGSMLAAWGGPLGQTLLKMQEQQLIRHLGVSLYSGPEFEIALQITDLKWIQIPFHVFDQGLDATGLLTQALESKRRLFIRSVFLQGLLVMDPSKAIQRVPGSATYLKRWWECVQMSKRSPASLAFQFVRTRVPAAEIIVGCESIEQLKANAQLVQEPPIDTKVMDLLEEFVAVPAEVSSPRLWS